MAKQSKAAATGTNVVAIKQGGAVAAAVPDYLKGYKGPTGTENISAAEVSIPRLKIAQALTPAVKAGTLKDGALYLSVTGQAVVGPTEPLKVVLIAYALEYILWRPRKDNNGGILARAKPTLVDGTIRYAWDKPNTVFDVRIDGKTPVKWKTGKYIDEDGLAEWGSEIPGNKDSGIAATAHYNYVVALPEHDNMVAAFSLSRSSAKKAKDLNATLRMSKGVPIFAKQFIVATFAEKKDNDDYFNVSFTPDGFVVEKAEFEFYRNLHEGFATGFNVDQSDADDDELAQKGV